MGNWLGALRIASYDPDRCRNREESSGGGACAPGLVCIGNLDEDVVRIRRAVDRTVSRRRGCALARPLRPAVRRVRAAGQGDGPSGFPRRFLSRRDRRHLLRRLARRSAGAGRPGAQAGDDEIRSYVLTAVANQASRELRRRSRKPTAPLELVGAAVDPAAAPDEIVVSAESSQADARPACLAAAAPPRRDAAALRLGTRAEPGLPARQEPIAARLPQGDQSRSRRADREDASGRTRRVVRRSRASAEGFRRRPRRLKTRSARPRLTSRTAAPARPSSPDYRGISTISAEPSAAFATLRRSTAMPGFGDRAIAASRSRSRCRRWTVRPADPTEIGDAAAGIATSGAARGGGTAGAGLFAQLAGAGAAGKAAIGVSRRWGRRDRLCRGGCRAFRGGSCAEVARPGALRSEKPPKRAATRRDADRLKHCPLRSATRRRRQRRLPQSRPQVERHAGGQPARGAKRIASSPSRRPPVQQEFGVAAAVAPAPATPASSERK